MPSLPKRDAILTFCKSGASTCGMSPNALPSRLPVLKSLLVRPLPPLDVSFFGVRFDRLTPLEKRYLRAMAHLGVGPHRSGGIAQVLGRPVTSLGTTRSQLIDKGMIWSPSHGDTAFTVPMFDEFMLRIMPGDDWRAAPIVTRKRPVHLSLL